jgi:Uma2 family endonuclease
MMEPTPQSSAGNPSMARAAREQTLYAALEALPERLTGEILEGQLYTQPRPTAPHVSAVSSLAMELGGPYSRGRGGPGGWWILVEPELHFVRDAEVAVPDLAGWRRERMPRMPEDHRIEIVPDWVCEVLSPSTRSKDREIKLPLYAKRGVRYAWLLDPRARTLEAFALERGGWTPLATLAAADTVALEPFAAARFVLESLWT